MHTKTYCNRLINVDKLLEFITENYYSAINKEITSLDLSTISITRDSGFSEERFKNADITKPILVDYNYEIIDGRHRILKSLLQNKSIISVIRIEKPIIMRFALKE